MSETTSVTVPLEYVREKHPFLWGRIRQTHLESEHYLHPLRDFKFSYVTDSSGDVWLHAERHDYRIQTPRFNEVGEKVPEDIQKKFTDHLREEEQWNLNESSIKL